MPRSCHATTRRRQSPADPDRRAALAARRRWRPFRPPPPAGVSPAVRRAPPLPARAPCRAPAARAGRHWRARRRGAARGAPAAHCRPRHQATRQRQRARSDPPTGTVRATPAGAAPASSPVAPPSSPRPSRTSCDSARTASFASAPDATISMRSPRAISRPMMPTTLRAFTSSSRRRSRTSAVNCFARLARTAAGRACRPDRFEITSGPELTASTVDRVAARRPRRPA